MKIILHPGLHKTGTTSIQRFLRSAFGSDEPRRVWYPMTTLQSPGHARLVSKLRSQQLREQGLQDLQDLVDRAAAAKTEVLMISAEDISPLPPGILAEMRDRFVGHFFELIITLTSHKARVLSLWQHRVREYETNPIDDARYHLDQRIDPGIVSRLVEALRPDDCIVIIGRKSNQPEWLINSFLEAGGLRECIDDPDNKLNYSLNMNRSFGVIETEILRHLNICIKALKEKGVAFDDRLVRRRIIRCVTSDIWRKQVSRVPIEFPESWTALAKEQALLAKSDLEKLLESGRIKVLGDTRSLVEGF